MTTGVHARWRRCRGCGIERYCTYDGHRVKGVYCGTMKVIRDTSSDA